ncbi:hypothetical protein SNEBB_010695 [Seison nebaliae]|nr:hypothetical protein SNEBB_010695 [Seison nebaliae]
MIKAASIFPRSSSLIQNVVKTVQQNGVRAFSIEQIGQMPEEAMPFDYEKRKYNGFWEAIGYGTYCNLGNNSLVFQFDGNLGSGKSKVAEKLAEDIQFKYIPFPDVDGIMRPNSYNLNFRELLNEKLPQRLQIPNMEMLCENPSPMHGGRCQFEIFRSRLYQYQMALYHLFNTSQGIVLNRSCHSDIVFTRALADCGAFRGEFQKFLEDTLYPNVLIDMWRPHLIVYVKKPIELCYKQLIDNGKVNGKTNKLINLDLLKAIEYHYENSYLPSAKNYSHYLEYDHSDEHGLNHMMEDIEELDFFKDELFYQWRVKKEYMINNYRMKCGNPDYTKRLIQANSDILKFKEAYLIGEDSLTVQTAKSQIPSMKYDDGFNAKQGDKDWWYRLDSKQLQGKWC